MKTFLTTLFIFFSLALNAQETLFEKNQKNQQCGFKNPAACQNKMFEGVPTTMVQKNILDKDLAHSACFGWCGDPNYRLSYDPREKENTYSDAHQRETMRGINGLLWKLEWK